MPTQTLTPEQVKQYYATEGNKPTPLSPLDWLKQQGAPLSGTNAQVPNQPQPQTGSILSFADTMNKAVNLAREKRNALSVDMMAPYSGVLNASDFNSILGNLNRASDTFTQDQLKQAQPTFDTISDATGAVYQVQKDASGQIIGQPQLLFGGHPASAGGTGTGSSNMMTDNERALFSQFRSEPIVKDYNTILQKKLSVEGIVQAGVGGPGDLALVYEFMKALDPTSVVRETEYATAAQSGNIFSGALARFNGYLKEEGGFLPPQVQSAFMSIINSKFQVQQKLYSNVASEYKRIADSQGLNSANVVIGYDAPSAPTYAPGTIIENGGKKYVVGADGDSLTPYSTGLDWGALILKK